MHCFLDMLLAYDTILFLRGDRCSGRAKLVDVARDAFGCLIDES